MIQNEAERADPVRLAEEFATFIQTEKLPARLLGGLAIYLRCPSAHREPLARPYNDLDAAVPQRKAVDLEKRLPALGWEPDKAFNALQGNVRLLFRKQGVDLDVFVGVFEQCHKLNLEPRLDRHPVTLSLADLLLTKLQVVQINRKDLTDGLALLLDHPVGEGGDPEEIDLRTIREVTANDWGWYTTVSDNLEKLLATGNELLPEEERQIVAERLATIREAMERAPKSLGWKMRAKIGRRVPWYVLPEEK